MAQIELFAAWLDGQIAIRELPGAVVGVVSDQELIWVKGFGHANVDAAQPMETDTRFRMASHSKLFTATAIMQLREEGKVGTTCTTTSDSRIMYCREPSEGAPAPLLTAGSP